MARPMPMGLAAPVTIATFPISGLSCISTFSIFALVPRPDLLSAMICLKHLEGLCRNRRQPVYEGRTRVCSCLICILAPGVCPVIDKVDRYLILGGIHGNTGRRGSEAHVRAFVPLFILLIGARVRLQAVGGGLTRRSPIGVGDDGCVVGYDGCVAGPRWRSGMTGVARVAAFAGDDGGEGEFWRVEATR